MTPKEKSKELVNEFYNITDYVGDCIITKYEAKQCALIAVNKIILQWEYIDIYIADINGELNPNLKYWYEVKQEIEKL